MNNKSNNRKNHIREYSNSNLKITDVKIPLHAWKLLGILGYALLRWSCMQRQC